MTSARPLSEMLREHYARQELSAGTARRLRAVGRAHSRGRLPSRRAVWLTAIGGIAALVVLVVGLLLPYRNASRSGHAPFDLGPSVIEAVRGLHLAASEPEVPADDYTDLSEMQDRLGFAPRAPRHLVDDDLSLTGARHATLLGSPSVHVMLVDSDGLPVSVFQTLGANVPVSGGRGIEQGTYVMLWHEDDLLMALARAAH